MRDQDPPFQTPMPEVGDLCVEGDKGRKCAGGRKKEDAECARNAGLKIWSYQWRSVELL